MKRSHKHKQNKQALPFLWGMLPLFLAVALCLPLLLTACAEKDVTQQAVWEWCGEKVELTAWGEESKIENLLTAFESILRESEMQLSTAVESSDVSRFNRSENGIDEGSERFVNLTKKALALSAATQGAFDITTGALSQLWRQCEARNTPPGEAEIAEALSCVGYGKLILEGSSVGKTDPRLTLDFGRMAGGYVLEELLAAATRMSGETMGGEIVFGTRTAAFGVLRGETTFHALIHDPLDEDLPMGFVLAHAPEVVTCLSVLPFQMSIAKHRYTALYNPLDGTTVGRDGLRGVVVVCADAALADALAQTLFVLGPSEGMKFYSAENDYLFEAAFIYENEVYSTENMDFNTDDWSEI